MEHFLLNNGVKMPKVSLGTFQILEDIFEKTIMSAYELGYRKFDTAWKYGNELTLSRAFKNLRIKREELFITTKIHVDALYYGGYKSGRKSIFNFRNTKSIKDVIRKSFDNLDTDYVDLFLIHWPWPIPIVQKIYEVLTSLYYDGYIKAIGVCSALPPHLQSLKDVSDVIPAVNQFEISPFNTQKKLISFCEEQNIQVEAMSTFSHFRDTSIRKDIFENKELNIIATKYGKTVAQIILKWLMQQNISIIPKSKSYTHLKENIDLEDFIICSDDMKIIDSLDKGKFLNYNPYVTLSYPCTLYGNVPKKYLDWKGFE